MPSAETLGVIGQDYGLDCTMNLRDIFLGVLKRKGFSLQVLRLKSWKVHFQTFDNVKDLAKLLKINDKVNLLFLITKTPKKIEPENPTINFA